MISPNPYLDSLFNKFLVEVQENPALGTILHENKNSYSTKLQIAKFAKINESLKKKNPVIYAGKDKFERDVYYVFGANVPDKESKQLYSEWVLLFITELEQRVNTNYFILVYFTTDIPTYAHVADFRDLLATMPIIYIKHLSSLVVAHANFIVKSKLYLTANAIQHYIYKITDFKDTLFELSKTKWFQYSLLPAISEEVKQLDKSYKDIVAREEKNLKNLARGVNVIFSDDDEELYPEKKFLGQKLEAYQLNAQKFPLILDVMISYYQQNQQCLLCEGIFRKQSSIFDERLLEAALANKKYKYIQRVEDPNVVACNFKNKTYKQSKIGLISKFFTELPEPVISFTIYNYLVSQSNEPDEQQKNVFCLQILGSLPPLNHLVLGVLLGFLREVIKFEQHNKMSAYNVAVVFAPCFFRAALPSIKDLIQYAKLFVSLTQKLLLDYENYFPGLNHLKYLTKNEYRRTSMIVYEDLDLPDISDLNDLMKGSKGFAEQKKEDQEIKSSGSDEDGENYPEQKFLGQKLEAYQLNTQQFPLILDVMISYCQQNQKCLLCEGIFRKQSSILDERLLEAALVNKKYKYIQRVEDPNVVACNFKNKTYKQSKIGLISKFFTELPEPVISFTIYNYLVSQSNEPDEQQKNVFCLQILGSLPPLNHLVLGVLLGFLREVIKFEQHNKMSAYNVAVVFAPCFFRAALPSIKDLIQYAKLFVSLTQKLLLDYENYFPGLNHLKYLTFNKAEQETQNVVKVAENLEPKIYDADNDGQKSDGFNSNYSDDDDSV